MPRSTFRTVLQLLQPSMAGSERMLGQGPCAYICACESSQWAEVVVAGLDEVPLSAACCKFLSHGHMGQKCMSWKMMIRGAMQDEELDTRMVRGTVPSPSSPCEGSPALLVKGS